VPGMARRSFEGRDVWALRTVTDPNLTADGATVAYVVGVPDEETDRIATSIWVGSTGQGGKSSSRPFTTGPRDSCPRWSPDGRWLAFIGEQDGRVQLFVAPLQGGAPRAVTDHPSGVSGPVWSPDSRRLAYVTRSGPWTSPADRSAVERSAPVVLTDLYNRYDNVGWLDQRRSHLWVVDVETGPSGARQLTDGDWEDFDPAWSPDGSLLAFVSDRSASRWEVPRRDVWVVAPDGRRRPRRLTRGRGNAGSPLFSPDSSAIAYIGHEHQAGDSSHNTHLLTVPVDGSRPPVSLSNGLDRTVFGTFPLVARTHSWVSDGGAVLFVAIDGGAHQLYRVPVPGDAAPTVVAGGDRQISAVDVSETTIVFSAAWPSSPVELYCIDADGTAERQVTDTNAAIRAAVRFAPLRRTSHRAADGSKVESLVLYPPGFKRGTPAPTVLEIHGGPHGCHPQLSMTPLYQALGAAGYVVVLTNPRGSHGYGEDWAGRCVGDWGGGDFEDLMGAVDALVDKGVADPSRLYVAGYSYGGFMTTWTVGHTDRFRAACISAPVLDLVSMYGTTDIPFFSEYEMGGTPWERPELYRERSPLSYLTDITTPVELLHWDGDLRCPVSQADELFQGLRRLGREAVLVRYPGGFHVARTPSQMADFVQRHLDWFAAH
jgi:dipeptidyl aminopeptidase/acylaminoacyl peptidase